MYAKRTSSGLVQLFTEDDNLMFEGPFAAVVDFLRVTALRMADEQIAVIAKIFDGPCTRPIQEDLN